MYGKVQVIMWLHVLYRLIYIYCPPNWLWFFLDLKYLKCFTDCVWGMFRRGPCLEYWASGWKTLCSSEVAVNASAPRHAGDWPACPLLAPLRCLRSLPLPVWILILPLIPYLNPISELWMIAAENDPCRLLHLADLTVDPGDGQLLTIPIDVGSPRAVPSLCDFASQVPCLLDLSPLNVVMTVILWL